MSKTKIKPKAILKGTLIELGQDVEYDVPVLKIRAIGAPEPIVTIPVSQLVVRKFAPLLYEKVVITIEGL